MFVAYSPIFQPNLRHNQKLLGTVQNRLYSSTEDADIVVIGSGPGGYVASIKAAQLGMKVCVYMCKMSKWFSIGIIISNIVYWFFKQKMRITINMCNTYEYW